MFPVRGYERRVPHGGDGAHYNWVHVIVPWVGCAAGPKRIYFDEGDITARELKEKTLNATSSIDTEKPRVLVYLWKVVEDDASVVSLISKHGNKFPFVLIEKPTASDSHEITPTSNCTVEYTTTETSAPPPPQEIPQATSSSITNSAESIQKITIPSPLPSPDSSGTLPKGHLETWVKLEHLTPLPRDTKDLHKRAIPYIPAKVNMTPVVRFGVPDVHNYRYHADTHSAIDTPNTRDVDTLCKYGFDKALVETALHDAKNNVPDAFQRLMNWSTTPLKPTKSFYDHAETGNSPDITVKLDNHTATTREDKEKLTENDKSIISGLCDAFNLGQDFVTEAYLSCNKDQDVTANLLILNSTS
ncbi:hypothetical protein Pelo_8585 [Pelomyxa schiedti]|nr:hypothetical protein Pelo_8585 [Pelomyxa schiedti]